MEPASERLSGTSSGTDRLIVIEDRAVELAVDPEGQLLLQYTGHIYTMRVYMSELVCICVYICLPMPYIYIYIICVYILVFSSYKHIVYSVYRAACTRWQVNEGSHGLAVSRLDCIL